MRLYVIGPVTGRENLNREAFENAKERLWDAGYDVLIPHDVVPPDASHEQAMRLSIKAMLGCGGVAALTDWDESRGAKLEREVAIACGLEIHCVDTWLLMADDSPENDNSPKETPNPPSPPSDGVTAPSSEALSALTRRMDKTRQKAMRAIGFLEGFSAWVWAHVGEEELVPELAGAYRRAASDSTASTPVARLRRNARGS